MKTMITAINAKFIHTSLAVRLLYLAARKEGHDAEFREFVIKDDPSDIAEEFLRSGCGIAAFSCYIWNIGRVEEVCRLLREKAELWDEFEHLYRTLFNNSDKYVAVMECLAEKKKRR